MSGGFLQTNAAQIVRKLVESQDAIVDVDRQSVLAFLSGEQASKYTPQSGQITGLLKQIGDEMAASKADEDAAEAASIQEHEDLVAAKSKEIAAHTKAIEEKTVRAGEVAVNIVNQKNDLKDTNEALAADQAFLKELESGCGTKEAEYNEHQKTRGEELTALAETVKLLNDDDALELFKKAIPGRGASFVQMASGERRVRDSAL